VALNGISLTVNEARAMFLALHHSTHGSHNIGQLIPREDETLRSTAGALVPVSWGKECGMTRAAVVKMAPSSPLQPSTRSSPRRRPAAVHFRRRRSRENEGDLCVAAAFVTPEIIIS